MKKKYRIKKNKEIQNLMDKKNTVGNKFFVIYFNQNHENNNFRFAIGVSKKYGNAVLRNLMKRRIREIVKNLDINENTDFFIISKLEAKKLSFSEMNEVLIKLFDKANLLRK